MKPTISPAGAAMATTRRSFLGGLAVATALTSAAAAHAATAAPENPELLALGEKFEQAHAKFLEIDDQILPLQAAYRSIAPNGEGVVFTHVPQWLRYAAETTYDPACPNYSKWKSPEGEYYSVIRDYCLDAQVRAGRIENDRYVKRLRKLAIQYERDVEHARQRVGLDVAIEQWSIAQYALRQAVSALCAVRAKTPAGIALKVRATFAYAAIGNDEKFTARLWISEAIWNDLGEEDGA